MAYVAASKRDRKYITAPGNAAYAAVCDWYDHLYVYLQPDPSRGHHATAPAPQYVVTLPRTGPPPPDTAQSAADGRRDELLGVAAFRDAIVLLRADDACSVSLPP